MERPPRGDGSKAAQWAHQHNLGETDEDRRDWRDGVRCRLNGGPFAGRYYAAQAEEQLHPKHGYAPEALVFESGEPGIRYAYSWSSRRGDGVHTYMFDCRGVWDGSDWELQILVDYQCGPLDGQSRWAPLPEDGEKPDTIQVENGVEYQRLSLRQRPGASTYVGRVRCKPKGSSMRWEKATDRYAPGRGYAPATITSSSEDVEFTYEWGHLQKDGVNVYRFKSSRDTRW